MKLKEDKRRTYVAIVLDESGSMGNIKDETISGLNEQIDVIKENAKEVDETYVSFTTFNQDVTNIFSNSEIGKLDKIDDSSYNPGGTTSLLDAVGYTIDELIEHTDIEDKNNRYLIVILSDGMENSSTDYGWDEVASKIDDLQSTEQWTFTYMGAIDDITELADDLNLKRGNISQFEATKSGTMTATKTMAQSMGDYMRNSQSGYSDCFYGGDSDSNGE